MREPLKFSLEFEGTGDRLAPVLSIERLRT
jgi:hypothetical protein